MPAGGIITAACPNIDGRICAVCGQIAFKIVIVEIGGKAAEVPICGQHYIETLRRSPVMEPAQRCI